MASNLLEHYTGLSIIETLRDASITSDLQVQGFRDPRPEDVEEWLAVSLEGIKRLRTRRNIWQGAVQFQVACFSRYQRADGEVNAPWQLAGEVRDALEHTDVAVKEYGTSGEEEIARLSINEADMSYGEGAESEGSKGVEVHYVVVSFTGFLMKIGG